MIRDPKADSYVCADCLFSERDTLLELTQKYRVTIEDRREDHNKLLAQTAEFAKTILELREQIKELKIQRKVVRCENYFECKNDICDHHGGSNCL